MRIRSNQVWMLALLLFFVGGGVLVLGDSLSIPFLHGLGLMIVAVAPLIIGLHAMITRRLFLLEWTYFDREKYTGFGAVAMGGFLFALGIFVLAASAAEMSGRNLGAAVDNHTGLAIAGLGVVALLLGVAQLNVVYLHHSGQPLAWYRLLGARFSGVLMILIGASVIAAGLLYSYSPGKFYELRLAAFEFVLSVLKNL